ncbi:helix-turn-helix domain-containing protein [Ornithinimicrobium sp. Arc0846-15]|nr:helix-turn-helix domain-containing protein [Ornithinimicrobium laminariae]
MHSSGTRNAFSFLNTAQVAERLGRSTWTINRWAEGGRLPTAAKAPGLRGARLFDPADVQALADELAAKKVTS